MPLVAFFLLTQFSPIGETTCGCRPVKVPWAAHAQALTLAPVVEVRRGEVVLNGELLGPAGALDVHATATRLAEMLGRFAALQENTGGTVVIAADEQVTFGALWPVMEAAFLSGASTVSLAVLGPEPRE
jgi:biopolymer transport protein ExbD